MNRITSYNVCYTKLLRDCLAVLFFLDYIISKVKGSTGQFELSVFIKQIIDKRFVKTKEYCLVLINEIPQRKLFDTVLEIYKNKNQIDIYNCELIFQCFYEKLTASNITSLLNIYSEELRTTESDNDIKYIIKLIDPCMWERISPIARIRTENRIVEAQISWVSWRSPSAEVCSRSCAAPLMSYNFV